MQISYIGMQTQEVIIKPTLKVILKADAQKLDEIVVTDKNGIINSSLFSDGLHPNTKGYEKIAEVVKTYLDN